MGTPSTSCPPPNPAPGRNAEEHALLPAKERLRQGMGRNMVGLQRVQGWDFPVLQWLRLHASNSGGPGFDPWLGNLIPYAVTKRSHRP